MTSSPLYPYMNASGIYISTYSSNISTSNGRLVTTTADSRYYLQFFLKRAQSSGTDSGSKDVPSGSGRTNVMPGYSGQAFLYRGYALRYSVIDDQFVLGDTTTGLTFTDFNSRPEWLTVGGSMQILFGDSDQVINCKIIISGGIYGSQGIDELIISEIKGIPITLLGGNYTTS